MTSRGGRAVALGAVVVAAAWVAVLGPGSLTGARLLFSNDQLGSDVWHFHWPLRLEVARQLSAGRLPLWCDGAGTGFSLAAEGQAAVFYPPTWAFFGLLPAAAGFMAFLLAHLLWAAGGAWRLARRWGAGPWAAVLAAVAFAWSGPVAGHLRHPNLLAALAWMPWVFAALDALVEAPRLARAAFTAVAAGAQVLAGHPQTVLITAVLGVPYVALVGVRESVRGGRAWAVRAAWLGAAALVGAALSAPQWALSLDLLARSNRAGGVEAMSAGRWDFALDYLVLALAPWMRGVPGALHRVGQVAGRGVWVDFEAVPGANPFYWEVDPFVGRIVVLLAVVAFAAPRSRRRALALWGLVVASVVLALGERGGVLPALRSVVPGLAAFRVAARFVAGWALFVPVAAAVGLEALATRLPRRGRTVGVLLAAAVVAVELSSHQGALQRTVDTRQWSEPPWTVRAMVAGRGGRVASLAGRWAWRRATGRARGWRGSLEAYRHALAALAPNAPMLWGRDAAGAYLPVHDRRLEVARRLVGALAEPASAERAARLLGVEWVVVRASTPMPDSFEQVGARDGVALYHTPSGARAWLVPAARAASPADAAAWARRLLSPGFDPSREVFVEGGTNDSGTGPGGGTVVRRGRHRWQVQVDAPAWLFVALAYAPGWRARVDGRDTALAPANGFGIALRVPAGRHDISLTYAPAALRWASPLAAFAALVSVVAFTIGWRRL